jgi:hypothetical protein
LGVTNREFAAAVYESAAEAIEALAREPIPMDGDDTDLGLALIQASRAGMRGSAKFLRAVAAAHRAGDEPPLLRSVS